MEAGQATGSACSRLALGTATGVFLWRQLIEARVRTRPDFAVTGRAVLFESDFATDALHADYDVTPDGKGFVMLSPTGEVAEVVVLLHWAQILKDRGSNKAP